MTKLNGIEESQLSRMVKLSVQLDTGNVGKVIEINMATISVLAYLNQHETIDVDSPMHALVQHSLGYDELFTEIVVQGKAAIAMSRTGHALLTDLFGSSAPHSVRGILDPKVQAVTRGI